MNSFSLLTQIGGPESAHDARTQEEQLCRLLDQWKGDYSKDVREFVFILRIDGEGQRFTAMWNVRGARSAKRRGDWLEVDIAIPEYWWREADTHVYKSHLAEEIEKGLHSMIELLRRNRRAFDAAAFLRDWEVVKTKFLLPATRNNSEQQIG